MLVKSSLDENRLVIYSQYGPLQFAFLIWGALSILLFILIFVKSFKDADGVKKKQITYIGIASLVASFIALSTNLFLPTYEIEVFGGIGPLSALIFSSIVTYAILKENVLNIKILFTEVIIFIFLSYSGAIMFLADNFSDFGFKFLSFVFTFCLSLILLRAINNESKLRLDLQNVYQNQSNFLADISHRLKTPIALSKTNLEIAKYNLKDKDFSHLEKSLFNANSSIEKTNRICTNIITLGKIDFGISKLFKEELDLSKLIKSAANDFKPLIGKRQLTIQIQPKIKFFGDQARIQEMVFNLLDNAVKFTDPVEGKIEVRLSFSDVILDSRAHRSFSEGGIEDPEHSKVLDSRWSLPRTPLRGGNDTKKRKNDKRQRILLIIADNGKGMGADVQKHLFERYYQAHNQSKSGSAGIGLAIVKWIVEGHEGKIEVKSSEGKGTKFMINFNINSSSTD